MKRRFSILSGREVKASPKMVESSQLNLEGEADGFPLGHDTVHGFEHFFALMRATEQRMQSFGYPQEMLDLHCCHVDDEDNSCPNVATIETNHETDPYAGTHACDEHLDDLLADGEVAHRISTDEEVHP